MIINFPLIRLGQVASVKSGFAFRGSDMGGVGVPVIKIKNIHPPNVDIKNVERVPYKVIDGNKRAEKFLLGEGDALVAMTGATVGKLGRFPKTTEQFYLNQRVGKLFLNEPDRANYDFLYYVLSQRKYVDQIFSSADGSAQANVSGDQIEAFIIPLPPIEMQAAISDILLTLDDKIENNRRMNETLEAMARAIFKSWFVDFDPVHAKAAGNPPAHMDADTAALFPNSFGDDGLPTGWSQKTLGDVCIIKSGKSPPTKFTVPDSENNISVYGGNGISWYTNQILFESPFIITGRVGTLGTVYCVQEKCWVSDNALCCFPSNEDAFELVYFAMKKIDYQSLNSGSTQPLLTQTTLKNQNIIDPSKGLISAFHQNTKTLFKKILANDKENKTLAELRDTLLPKLMSGEICVADAEREVEPVV